MVSIAVSVLVTVSPFDDHVWVNTNVPLSSEESAGRAIGTRCMRFTQKSWMKAAGRIVLLYVYDVWYITAYQPIHNQFDNVIGMLYTGYLTANSGNVLNQSWWNQHYHCAVTLISGWSFTVARVISTQLNASIRSWSSSRWGKTSE